MKGGFARLLAEGEWHVGRHPSMATITAPGHTLLGTGQPPATSGVLGNEWWSRDDDHVVYAVDHDGNSPWLLVPGLGDIAGALVAVYALRVARNLRAPQAIQLHMLTNIAMDALIGMIPVLGDIFDFAFRAQTRNLALLDAWMGSPARTTRRSRRGLILIPIAIVIVFATLTALGVWMLVILFHWLAGLAA
jgi:hypothetical protein